MPNLFYLQFTVDWHDAPPARPGRQRDEPVLDVVGTVHANDVLPPKADLGQSGRDLRHGLAHSPERLGSPVRHILDPDLGWVLVFDLVQDVLVQGNS